MLTIVSSSRPTHLALCSLNDMCIRCLIAEITGQKMSARSC